MIDFEITELNRGLANMILLGKVIEADYSQPIPKLQVRIDELQTAWLPMLMQRAGPDISWWPLEVGEQVDVLSPSGELTQGVVIGSINQTDFPSTSSSADSHKQVYSDGAVIEYDRKAHRLSAILPSGAKAMLVSDGGINFVGDVTVTGDIKASGDITDHTRSMKSDRDIFNSDTHAGIKSGLGNTAPPNQSQ